MNRPKIKFRNFWPSIGDQIFRKKAFYNIFISHNAWGIFSINSHIRGTTQEPKVTYNTKLTALKAAEKMGQKYNKHFSVYKCMYCDGYHVGKNRDNK